MVINNGIIIQFCKAFGGNVYTFPIAFTIIAKVSGNINLTHDQIKTPFAYTSIDAITRTSFKPVTNDKNTTYGHECTCIAIGY